MSDLVKRLRASPIPAESHRAEAADRIEWYEAEHVEHLRMREALANNVIRLEAELAEAKKRQHMSDLNYDVLERALARSQGVEADLAAMLIRTERAEAELAKWKDAERRLSDAYLRLRGILGAWETPNAPTAEQVWVHTEAKARELAA
ncbi:MAG TPA: hypothetical protein VM163_07755, partial [bacterium]|nr:hypothetical protein [bacterium]